MTLYAPGATWDEHRNTSRVFPPAHDAAEQGIRAMAYFKRTQPALYAWIAEGAPYLSEEEHLRRFGEPYKSHRSRGRAV